MLPCIFNTKLNTEKKKTPWKSSWLSGGGWSLPATFANTTHVSNQLESQSDLSACVYGYIANHCLTTKWCFGHACARGLYSIMYNV